MARREARPRAERERVLRPLRRCCPEGGRRMPIRYENRRTVATLDGPVRLRLKVRRCENGGCARHHRPYRPEAEGAIALPQHEFGLDVIASVGALRYREHRSVPEIHRGLRERGVAIAERTVTHLLDRYDELLATTLAGLVRLHLRIRRCENPACARHRRPYRPEAEGAIVLPQHEFGLDVIARVGAWRYREHRSVPEIHRGLRERGVAGWRSPSARSPTCSTATTSSSRPRSPTMTGCAPFWPDRAG